MIKHDQQLPAATSSYQQLLAATSSYHLHMSHIASFRIALVMPLFLPCEAKLAPGIRVNVGQCPVQLWQRNSKCCYDNNNAIGNPELSLGMCLLWLSCTLCKVSERFCCFNMFQSVFVITCDGPRSKEGFLLSHLSRLTQGDSDSRWTLKTRSWPWQILCQSSSR
jgi:hypothetical protein